MDKLAKKTALEKHCRRSAIKAVSGGVYAALAGVSVAGGPISGSELPSGDGLTPFQMLIEVHQDISKEVCLQEGDRLSKLVVNGGVSPQSFYLHWRNSRLNSSDARKLASAMQSLSTQPACEMTSFSVSYSLELQQEGIATLVNALPDTLQELGMVGCDMTDKSAGVLLKWASRAGSLGVICVEDNRLTDQAKNQFTALRENRKDLMVIV